MQSILDRVILLQATEPAADENQQLTFEQPVGALPIVDDARWSAAFTDSSWAALGVWIVLLIALQVVSWPLVKRLFRQFPDRGWGFARLVSLLLASYAVWLLASVEIIAFRAIWSGLALALIAGACSLAGRWLYRGGRESSSASDPDERPWQSKTILAAEVVFWGVFGLFLLYRLLNPDSYQIFWGGEKPMEFAHLNAILRSAHFPPVDPWYAGGYLNYYYYGMYLVAFMVKLTGIPSEIAFNLAQPTIIALMASGSFSVAAALGRRVSRAGGGLPVLSGALGVLFVLFLGNLVAAARLVSSWINGLPPVYEWSYWFWDPSRAIPIPGTFDTITEFPYFTATFADLHAHVVALPITILLIGLAYSLAIDRRFMLLTLGGSPRHTQSAFSVAARLMLSALALGTLFATNAWDVPMYAALTGVALLMATAGVRLLLKRLVITLWLTAAVGALAYLLILPFTSHYVALFGSLDTVRDKTPLRAIESHFGGLLLLLTVGIAVLMARRAPFPHGVRDPLVPLSTISTLLALRWYGTDRSEMIRQLADYGTVVAVVGVWAAVIWPAIPRRSDFSLGRRVVQAVLVVALLASLGALLTERPVLALYLGIGSVAGVLWFSLRNGADRFVAAMIAGGMLVGAALEIVYLVDDLTNGSSYRMNTIFKFYNQLWILFALAAAALIGRAVLVAYTGWVSSQRDAMLGISPGSSEPLPHALRQGAQPVDAQSADRGEGREAESVGEDKRTRRWQSRAWSYAAVVVTALVVAASLVYPVMGTGIRLDMRFEQPGAEWTLNAYDWMDYGEILYADGNWVSYDEDRAVIDWFNSEVDGTPVIAEASFGPYRCNGSRFSIATGLPAVVGWVRHQEQQRPADDLYERQDALKTLYTSSDTAEKARIIDQYNIEYIIVGETERNYPVVDGNNCVPDGSDAGITAFEQMVGSRLNVAFTAGSTVVYQVIGEA